MTAFDAVDDSHHRHRDFRLWHKTEVPPASRDFRFWAFSGHHKRGSRLPFMTPSGSRQLGRAALGKRPLGTKQSQTPQGIDERLRAQREHPRCTSALKIIQPNAENIHSRFSENAGSAIGENSGCSSHPGSRAVLPAQELT